MVGAFATWWSAPVAAVVLATGLVAQRDAVDRHELGVRLRDFERAFAATAEPARRRAASVELEGAVRAFFGLDFAAAAMAVDAAHAAALGQRLDARTACARRLWLFLPQRLLAEGDGALACEVRVLPLPQRRDDDAPDPAAPMSPALPGCALVVRRAEPAQELVRVPLAPLPRVVSVPLATLPPGDHVLQWNIVTGDEVLVVRELGVSLVAARDRRLQALAAPSAAGSAARTDLEGLTQRALVAMVRGMTRTSREETVLPGARLLAEAEALAALAPGAAYYGDARAGQFWLRVPTPDGAVPVRLVVPAAPAPAAGRPLVLALHGAGGSENLFCDGYGDGAIVRLCAARGWLLCAPRGSLLQAPDLAALVAGLRTRFAIDPTRVFVVGHSMGAMQATGAVMREPARYAALAALGGGGVVRAQPGLERLPCFVATGSRDFARGAANALHAALGEAGVTSRWLEYPDVEHLAIVQVALPDVFAFFDEVAAAPPPK